MVVFPIGGLRLDSENKTVNFQNKPYSLSPMSFKVLHYLIEQSPSDLSMSFWRWHGDYFVSDRAVYRTNKTITYKPTAYRGSITILKLG